MTTEQTITRERPSKPREAAVVHLEQIPAADIKPSPTNPRRPHDAAAEKARLAELTLSIQRQGILQPVLVRPFGAKGEYQLICGHRRLAAALTAGLETVPALVRMMSDQEALEVQLVENLQRADLHPLEEAQGYHQLLIQPGYTVERIAEKIGHPTRYVADRLRLLVLTKPAQRVFLEGKITVGHAILLARLSPKDQERAMALDHGHGGLFQSESLLWDPEEGNGDDADPVKARSVAELKAWIDEHVKLNPAAGELLELFPETAAKLQAAKEAAEKVVHITHDNYVQPDARDGKRVMGPRSWKRADGRHGSKTCEHAITGVIVIGPGRGEAYKVCIDRTCKLHWAAEAREAKRRALGGPSRNAAAEQAAAEKRKAAEVAREAARARWKKAAPAIAKAVAASIAKTSAKATGPLGDLLASRARQYSNQGAEKILPRGRTAEDLVRHLAFMEVYDELTNEWRGSQDGPKIAKLFGVDIAKILAEAGPAAAAPKPKRARK